MIQLLPTNLYAVIVPQDARGFCKHENGNILYLHGQGLSNMCSSIQAKYDDHSILGTVTKDHIDFDFEQYLFSDKAEGMFYKYGNGSYDLKDRQNAFYHLLAENGFHFVNPIDPKRRIIGDSIGQLLIDYVQYEDNLVKKVLILKTL